MKIIAKSEQTRDGRGKQAKVVTLPIGLIEELRDEIAVSEQLLDSDFGAECETVASLPVTERAAVIRHAIARLGSLPVKLRVADRDGKRRGEPHQVLVFVSSRGDVPTEPDDTEDTED